MSRKQKILLIFLLTLGVSFLHFTTGARQPVLHLIHRELYLIPVILCSYWFGKKWGLTMCAIAAMLFLPWTFMGTMEAGLRYHVLNVIEIMVFFLVAYFVGFYHDARVSHFGSLVTAPEVPTRPLMDHGRNLLLCIHNSPNVLKAAKYVANTFASQKETTVTVLEIVREPSFDLFNTREEWENAKKESQSEISRLTEQTQNILVEGGFPKESIQIKASHISKESVALKIMEEQEQFHYDTIVIGGTKMSKAQEFLFGNAAVKLVREAGCPIITVY
ncbi:MAG TPA: universal stress protein [Thermodesulfobacteriota bacterium]|nr:universal stress protein [Thermodesulfobacteriota bacterium]